MDACHMDTSISGNESRRRRDALTNQQLLHCTDDSEHGWERGKGSTRKHKVLGLCPTLESHMSHNFATIQTQRACCKTIFCHRGRRRRRTRNNNGGWPGRPSMPFLYSISSASSYTQHCWQCRLCSVMEEGGTPFTLCCSLPLPPISGAAAVAPLPARRSRPSPQTGRARGSTASRSRRPGTEGIMSSSLSPHTDHYYFKDSPK